MKVLVACEFSGRIRDAFINRGHDAISCDLLPTESPGPHFMMDVRTVLKLNKGVYDLMIAHPPCTYLAVCGARWWRRRRKEQMQAIQFFITLTRAEIPKICIENPVGIMSTWLKKPDQYIQPWQFGHGETKKTGLWLKGLPLLEPTNIVEGREARIHKMSPGPERSKNRSLTYQGIADAMAEQWG